MQRARLINDLYELSMNTKVEFDIDDGWIIVKNVYTPEGWEPDPIDLRLEIEEYPTHPPVVYVPDELRYEESRPHVMMPPSTQGEPDWCQLDIGLGTAIEWEPTHTVTDVVRLAMRTLRAQRPSTTSDDLSTDSIESTGATDQRTDPDPNEPSTDEPNQLAEDDETDPE